MLKLPQPQKWQIFKQKRSISSLWLWQWHSSFIWPFQMLFTSLLAKSLFHTALLSMGEYKLSDMVKRLLYLCNSPGEAVSQSSADCLFSDRRKVWLKQKNSLEHCLSRPPPPCWKGSSVHSHQRHSHSLRLCWGMNFNQTLQHSSAVEICPQRFGSC